MAAAAGVAVAVEPLVSEAEPEPRNDMVPHFTTTLRRQKRKKETR